MEREFIPYNLALELKELGFDESCFGFYNIKGNFIKDFDITRDIIENLEIKSIELHRKICLAPLYQQAFRWLYQKLDIEKGIMPLDTESQQLLLKELIDKVSSKHLLV